MLGDPQPQGPPAKARQLQLPQPEALGLSQLAGSALSLPALHPLSPLGISCPRSNNPSAIPDVIMYLQGFPLDKLR